MFLVENSSAHSLVITCLWIHVKKRPLRFWHLEGQLPLRGRVHVCGQHLEDGPGRVHVLLHGREVHRLGKLWSVIVNVQDLQEDVSPGDQRLRPQIGDVHREPVVRRCLAVQSRCCTNHTWETGQENKG